MRLQTDQRREPTRNSPPASREKGCEDGRLASANTIELKRVHIRTNLAHVESRS
jgi:hypothetical protein